MTRSITMHPLFECSHPYDNLSCLFFTAPWLHQNQSVLVHQIQTAKDIDLTCFKTLPIKASTCMQWIHLQDLIKPALPPPMEIPTTNIKEALFQIPHSCFWYSMALQVGKNVPMSAMYCQEHWGSRWVSFSAQKNRGARTQMFQEAP